MKGVFFHRHRYAHVYISLSLSLYVCIYIYIYNQLYIYIERERGRHRIHFENGEEAPTTQTSAYLGSRVHYNGDHKCEVTTRITAVWLAVMKLDLFWRKTSVTLKWKLRVLDAAIHSKSYMEWEHSSFHNLITTKLALFRLGSSERFIKHSFWSHVTNDTVMNTANTRAQDIDETIEVTPLSFKLKQRAIKFDGHITRSGPDTDQMRAISIDEDGNTIDAQTMEKWNTETKMVRHCQTSGNTVTGKAQYPTHHMEERFFPVRGKPIHHESSR